MTRRASGTLLALMTASWLATAVGAADPVPTPAASGGPPSAERAVELYDEERYAEAREEIAALESAGKADGPLLYRLSYCLGLGSDRDARDRMLARAVAALEKETAAGGGLESWFYLAGGYRNQGRALDAARIAAEATGRIETGSIAKTERPVDLFRVAKLYEDQGRAEEAAAWYRKALEGFAGRPGKYPAYERWSRRYLGELALTRSDWEGAEREYSLLASEGRAEARDWFRLAVARSRMGRFEAAAEAWRESDRANPGAGDNARYARQLALQAAEIGILPSFSPDGRTWDRMSKDDLEQIMTERAKVAREVPAKLAQAADPSIREETARELGEARRIFLAAGLEYAVRGLPIRETAFAGGYAPLVFHADRWKVPEPGNEGEAPPGS